MPYEEQSTYSGTIQRFNGEGAHSPVPHRFAFGLTTIARKASLEQCIGSLRERFPKIPIYVADQNGGEGNAPLYSRLNVTPLWLEWDAGLSTARNTIFTAAVEDYLLLIDDDDVLESECDEKLVRDLCDLLEDNPDWLVIGGQIDRWHPYQLRMSRDKSAPEVLVIEDCRESFKVSINGASVDLIECESVMNFAVFARRRLIEWQLFWDESLKVMEHLDFYLSVKEFREATGRAKVHFCPGLRGRSLPRQRGHRYTSLRFRYSYTNLVARKWKIKQTRSLVRGHEQTVWLSRDHIWVEALKKIQGALLSADVPWWVSGRTLLGLSTVGNFFAHDTYMEITVLANVDQTRKLERAVRQSGALIMKARGLPGDGLQWDIIFPRPANGHWIFGDIKIVMSFAEQSRQSFTVATCGTEVIRRFEYPRTPMRSQYVKAWQLHVQVPADSTSFLETEFGLTWATTTDETDGCLFAHKGVGVYSSRKQKVRSAFYRFRLYIRTSDAKTWFRRLPYSALISETFMKLRGRLNRRRRTMVP